MKLRNYALGSSDLDRQQSGALKQRHQFLVLRPPGYCGAEAQRLDGFQLRQAIGVCHFMVEKAGANFVQHRVGLEPLIKDVPVVELPRG